MTDAERRTAWIDRWHRQLLGRYVEAAFHVDGPGLRERIVDLIAASKRDLAQAYDETMKPADNGKPRGSHEGTSPSQVRPAPR